ncbi:hypothetical protein [Arthrobacter sp. ES1]|uniref:hypothetical protein n=1 Tax=Arthrobacter sp. ES1 TaxID=1897056 RepID=UPI001CFF6DCC|nr:hypothetical protein [Arthrobacter sp. ES1]MCB5280341.1 hypothetical protein [Arthrobacter sp. ES1]
MALLTEIRRREAAPLAPERPASPDPETDKQFELIAKNFTVIELSTAKVPEKNRITVLLDLPELARFGRETTLELVYGCNFAVAVGDLVSCPPTPHNNTWTTGVVTALDGGRYRGRVKHVRKIKPEPTPESENTTS